MFGVSSSTSKVDLKHSYAAAVGGISSSVSGGRSLGRTTVAVVAVGVSALVGGGLLYGASRRADGGDDERQPKSVSGEGASSWWQRVLGLVRLRRPSEDDDDAFASGTGAANLFDEEKIKARQLSKDKSKPLGRASTAAVAPSRKVVKPGSPPEAKSDVLSPSDYPPDIQERDQHIKLVRALLRREAGIEYSDDDDGSSSSDSTDVSLNYHFASTMEATARDDLLMAFAAFEDVSDGNIYGSTLSGEGMEGVEELQVNILVKTLEYLDMSNEREKLRFRRIAMHREQGRGTPASSVDAADGEGEDDDPMDAMYRQLAARYGPQNPHHSFEEEDERDADHFFPTAAGRQARQFQAMFGPSMMGMDPHAEDTDTGDSILDRIMGQAPASAKVNGRGTSNRPSQRAAVDDKGEDMMEEEWEDENDEDEADFMAYLQQPDDAAHFYSRKEMRQARRDPGNDVRVVGEEGGLFGFHADDDDAGDEDGWEDDEAGEEEDDVMPAEPWSRQDKADFERELFGRIYQLASNYTLTAAMAEREANEEDTRKLAMRQQRRQEHQKARSATTAAAPDAKTVKASQPAPQVVEDDEEWEDDEDEWVDEEEAA